MIQTFCQTSSQYVYLLHFQWFPLYYSVSSLPHQELYYLEHNYKNWLQILHKHLFSLPITQFYHAMFAILLMGSSSLKVLNASSVGLVWLTGWAMPTKLASDDVYSETSQWMMTSVGRGFRGKGCAWSVNPYSERHGKQITIANGCLLHYSTSNFTYHINRVRRDDWGRWRMFYRSWAPLTNIWSCKMCGKYCKLVSEHGIGMRRIVGGWGSRCQLSIVMSISHWRWTMASSVGPTQLTNIISHSIFLSQVVHTNLLEAWF